MYPHELLPARQTISHKTLRLLKREAKARAYRAVALSGGGKREVARRSGETFRGKNTTI